MHWKRENERPGKHSSGKLRSNNGIVVTFDSNIPRTLIRIHDSRTMIIYGIGKDQQPGFTLVISIDTNSKQGQDVENQLREPLSDFLTFRDGRAVLHVKDYGTNMRTILSDLNAIITIMNGEWNFNISNTSGTFELN